MSTPKKATLKTIKNTAIPSPFLISKAEIIEPKAMKAANTPKKIKSKHFKAFLKEYSSFVDVFSFLVFAFSNFENYTIYIRIEGNK